jgi:hypothetical protein
MEARVDADLGLTGTNARRIDNLLAHAARLRRLYAIDVGAQRAFFELQTDDFALLSIDTGILRTVCDAPFYPRTDHLRAKMDAEMPQWKQPFWYWTKWFNAWPFSIETFSGIFDFNRPPFFQSFMEVRVERSKKRFVLILNGVHGPLQWRDLQTGGAAIPSGVTLEDPAEFIVSMDRQ